MKLNKQELEFLKRANAHSFFIHDELAKHSPSYGKDVDLKNKRKLALKVERKINHELDSISKMGSCWSSYSI